MIRRIMMFECDYDNEMIDELAEVDEVEIEEYSRDVESQMSQMINSQLGDYSGDGEMAGGSRQRGKIVEQKKLPFLPSTDEIYDMMQMDDGYGDDEVPDRTASDGEKVQKMHQLYLQRKQKQMMRGAFFEPKNLILNAWAVSGTNPLYSS